MRWAVLGAAIFGVGVAVLLRRVRVAGGELPDYTPHPVGVAAEPAVPIGPDEGPVMVTVEYQIDPAQASAFAGLRTISGFACRPGAPRVAATTA